MTDRNNVSGRISVRVGEYDRDVSAALEAGVDVDLTIRGVQLWRSQAQSDAVYLGATIHVLEFAGLDVTAAPTHPRTK